MPRILVVDDNEFFRNSLRKLIEQHHDWSVCGEAENGREAVERAIELKPDVILLDIHMPRLDGLNACRLIRQKVPTSRVLILSMYQSLDLARIAADAGAWGYLSKNFVSTGLISEIEAMMNHREARTTTPKLQPATASSSQR
jgi:two-component system response regulator NreC